MKPLKIDLEKIRDVCFARLAELTVELEFKKQVKSKNEIDTDPQFKGFEDAIKAYEKKIEITNKLLKDV